MLLSVCMKDYVARSYGHTPRKLPLKSVPLRATSRFIAYQAEIIILYLLQFVKKIFSIYEKKLVKFLTKFAPCFCALSPTSKSRVFPPPTSLSLRRKDSPKSAIRPVYNKRKSFDTRQGTLAPRRGPNFRIILPKFSANCLFCLFAVNNLVV